MQKFWMTIAIVLAGCQPVTQPVSENILPFESEIFRALPLETSTFTEEFDCHWLSQGRAAFDKERFDHACHGGRWGTASLLVDEATGYPKYVGRVRLIWREWAHEDARVSEKDVAGTFVKAVTDRLVPPSQTNFVNDLFLGRSNQMIDLGNGALLLYTYKTQKNAGIHRLEIRARPEEPSGEKKK